MTTYITLNQRDNDPHVLARADAQCGPTAHASGLFQDDWFYTPQFAPNQAERRIMDVVQAQSGMSAATLTNFLGVEDATDLVGYLGKPGSTNACYIALSQILKDLHPLKKLASGTEYGSYRYATGENRLIERGGLNAGQIRDLFLSVRDSLGDRDWIVCLIKPFSWGHYVNILGIDEYGLDVGDPYGIPSMVREGYGVCNDRSEEWGKTYRLTWDQAELPTMRPNNRIHIIRPE